MTELTTTKKKTYGDNKQIDKSAVVRGIGWSILALAFSSPSSLPAGFRFRRLQHRGECVCCGFTNLSAQRSIFSHPPFDWSFLICSIACVYSKESNISTLLLCAQRCCDRGQSISQNQSNENESTEVCLSVCTTRANLYHKHARKLQIHIFHFNSTARTEPK